jgi:hypothetical protein
MRSRPVEAMMPRKRIRRIWPRELHQISRRMRGRAEVWGEDAFLGEAAASG